MAGFWRSFFGLDDYGAEPAPVGMKAQPAVINPNVGELLNQAHYRIGAIRRTIEQSPNVGPQRMREFFASTVASATLLHKAEQITDAEYAEMIAFVHGKL